MRKPFYKKSHKAYYCEIDRKQIRLGPDKDAAIEEYHRLMAGHIPATSRTPAVVILDQFLQWTKENRSERTFEWYYRPVKSFAEFIGSKSTPGQLRPNDVSRWLDRHYKDTSASYRNGACRAIARAFNWAKRQGLIQVNPVSGFERPAAEPREAYITADQWTKLLAAVPPENALHDLLVFLYENRRTTAGSQSNRSKTLEPASRPSDAGAPAI